MPIPHKYLNDHIYPALCLLTFVAVSGCQWLTGGGWREDTVLPTTDAAASDMEQSAADRSGDRAVLARDVVKDDQGRGHSVWIRVIRTAEDDVLPSHYRWSCPAIEDIMSRPAELRPDLHAYINDGNKTISTHAAIFLARAGNPAGAKQLAKAVRNPDFRLPMRCAAVESLANLSDQDATEKLHKLIDQYGRRTSDGRSAYNAKLHAELIRALARHIDPADDTCFVDALGSRSAEVRLEAIRAWSASRHGTLPEEAARLCDDRDGKVRTAALTAVAKRRHPRAHEYIAGAINDHDLQVRTAAVGALAELRDAQARESLEKLLENPAERIRAEAVTALAKLEDKPLVLEAAGDRSWRVRLSVARSLGRYPDRDGTAAAMQLLDDPSTRVAQAVVTSVAEWSLDKSGAILLEAMAGDSFQVRKLAAEQLAERWTEAAEFTASASPQRRRKVLEKLQGEFRRHFVKLDKTSEPRGLSPRQISPQDKPGGSPEIFKLLDRLDTSDTVLRRRAAIELVEAAHHKPLSHQAVAKLCKLVEAEPDQAVWRSVLTAVADDPSEEAARLAYAAIGHPSPEVRRRACEHLAAHPDPRHAKVLTKSLQDPGS